MKNSTTLLQLQKFLFLCVLTKRHRVEMSLWESEGTMTMAMPFRQKATVKILLET